MRLIIKEVFLHMLTNGKKIFAFVLIFCLAFCFLTPASAAGEIFVDNASLDVWENGWPEYWNFDSDGAMIEQMQGEDGSSCAKITLTDPGYAFLSQEIQLESEKGIYDFLQDKDGKCLCRLSRREYQHLGPAPGGGRLFGRHPGGLAGNAPLR